MAKVMYIYVLSNKSRSTLYVGVTNNILRRIEEHKQNTKGFAYRYKCFDLVYYEEYDDPMTAITREKEIKKWRREKKMELIKTKNPFLKNLIRQVL